MKRNSHGSKSILQRHAVDLASEGLRLNTLRYNAGEATIIELVDAQTNVVQARNMPMRTVCCDIGLR